MLAPKEIAKATCSSFFDSDYFSDLNGMAVEYTMKYTMIWLLN